MVNEYKIPPKMSKILPSFSENFFLTLQSHHGMKIYSQKVMHLRALALYNNPSPKATPHWTELSIKN